MARGVGGLFEGGNYFRYFHDGYFSRKYGIPMWKGLSSSAVIAPTFAGVEVHSQLSVITYCLIIDLLY